jgi:hypothetical protein
VEDFQDFLLREDINALKKFMATSLIVEVGFDTESQNLLASAYLQVVLTR